MHVVWVDTKFENIEEKIVLAKVVMQKETDPVETHVFIRMPPTAKCIIDWLAFWLDGNTLSCLRVFLVY